MMWVETMMHMSGTRANGEKYPPGWTPFLVEDWEGEHLIRGGIARQVERPSFTPPPQDPPPAPAPSIVSGDAGAGQPPAPVPAPVQVPVPSAGPPPAPSDPKQAWVDYAVAQGMDADSASRMTKADLQSRFGPRL